MQFNSTSSGVIISCTNMAAVVCFLNNHALRFLTENLGGLPLLRKFYVRTGVNLTGFTCVNKIREDTGTDCVNATFPEKMHKRRT